MKKAFKSILSIILSLSMLICATVPAFAVDGEEYICELRIIYADDYEEAKEILADGEFKDYKLLKENLNEGTGEIGVWLAYKTTTDIEDAITDLAVMQMNGGYKEGNYQEMIKQSYEEYVTMGETYLKAIEYFIEAYDAGDYLAEAAYRQLNFYNVESEGIPEDKIPYFEGERIGDIFYNGIDEYDLATMFLQGNSYVLNNIRALIALGVSYNEDGKTYLDKVGEEVEEFKADSGIYDDEDYDELAALIAPSILVFSDMFKELATVEDELNYNDDEFTDKEIRYLEYKSMAETMSRVNYLGDKTLYQFCLDYKHNEEDYSLLYPLVAALNDGQVAMTQVAHYYDVVRYSVSGYSEEAIDQKLSEMEDKYSDNPLNIYEGVDRSIYYGTFALTSEAYRADAYTDESSLYDALFGEGNLASTIVSISSGVIGACIFTAGIRFYGQASSQAATQVSLNAADTLLTQANDWASTASQKVIEGYLNGAYAEFDYTKFLDTILGKYFGDSVDISSMTFADKFDYVSDNFTSSVVYEAPDKGQAIMEQYTFKRISDDVNTIRDSATTKSQQTDAVVSTTSTSMGAKLVAGALYVVGGILMLYSAISLIVSVYNYYHPDYEDIPLAMVDLINTVDGDRYIKYDVVFEGETNDDGVYEAADLNAFEAERWNALYYTKSYEAGKPLLADEFSVSNSSNQPKENYTPVHKFGEVVCYNLNRYNFDYDTDIYLSVKQSKNNKAAVAGVPEVVGSMFGAGFLLLAGGIGAVVGVGGTIFTQSTMKRRKLKNNADTEE